MGEGSRKLFSFSTCGECGLEGTCQQIKWEQTELWPEREEGAGRRSLKQSMGNEVIIQQTGQKCCSGWCAPRGPRFGWWGWRPGMQVWSPPKAVLLPEPVCLLPDRAPGLCFSSRAPSANVQSKLMACSRCSIFVEEMTKLGPQNDTASSKCT